MRQKEKRSPVKGDRFVYATFRKISLAKLRLGFDWSRFDLLA
jgi:hypothetical protein